MAFTLVANSLRVGDMLYTAYLCKLNCALYNKYLFTESQISMNSNILLVHIIYLINAT